MFQSTSDKCCMLHMTDLLQTHLYVFLEQPGDLQFMSFCRGEQVWCAAFTAGAMVLCFSKCSCIQGCSVCVIIMNHTQINIDIFTYNDENESIWKTGLVFFAYFFPEICMALLFFPNNIALYL